jgi:prevent-host-death family protein
MSKTVLAKTKKKPRKQAESIDGVRRMAAGEFKAKCLGIMDEVKETGRPLIVTKRGVPVIEVFPARNGNKKSSILGRLEGIIKIKGDPDDFVKPIFPLEDWDMLK